MVLPCSHRVSRVPWYSFELGRNRFRVPDYHRLWSAFPYHSTIYFISISLRWADPRSLAATDGISIDFFSCRYLDVSVPCVRLVHLCIQCTMTGHNPCRVSPFGNLRFKACLAAPRSLSQLTTSFIASRCQGIHHAPLVA